MDNILARKIQLRHNIDPCKPTGSTSMQGRKNTETSWKKKLVCSEKKLVSPDCPLGSRSEVRGSRSEVRGQRPEVQGPRPEVRGPRSEVRGPRSEVRGPRSEVATRQQHPLSSSISQFLTSNVHFVRKGRDGPSKIAIFPQFLTSNLHFACKRCP